jgi:enoyl-CoA hydratase
MPDLVLCEKRDGVALLTLNRPRQLNALNYALIDRLMSLLDAIEDDPHTKAVVLTGAGDKAFSGSRRRASAPTSLRLGRHPPGRCLCRVRRAL